MAGSIGEVCRIHDDEQLPSLMSLPPKCRRKDVAVALLTLGMAVLAACGGGDRRETPDPAAGGTEGGQPATTGTMSGFSHDSAAMLEHRAAKDQAFRGEGSPIPQEVRGTFAGLGYYPPNGALVVDATLEKLEPPEPVSIAATKGDVRKMLRYGRFRFVVDGTPCTLTAFTSEDHPTTLFIPFRDRTNGSETYEVGRYIDMEVSGGEKYRLDFNMAYNPYCAYNANYTCPIVPRENVLPVAIPAGEKLPAGLSH
jgi:uncharacterized protein (DUF1684 family)